MTVGPDVIGRGVPRDTFEGVATDTLDGQKGVPTDTKGGSLETHLAAERAPKSPADAWVSAAVGGPIKSFQCLLTTRVWKESRALRAHRLTRADIYIVSTACVDEDGASAVCTPFRPLRLVLRKIDEDVAVARVRCAPAQRHSGHAVRATTLRTYVRRRPQQRSACTRSRRARVCSLD